MSSTPAVAGRRTKMRAFGLEVFRRSPKKLRAAAIRSATPSFTVGVVVVLRRAKDGAILMVRQRHTGAWALPGGLMKRGETSAEGAARELYEEVGIRVDLRDAKAPIAVLRAEARCVDLAYVVDADPGVQPRRNDPAEVTRVGWFSLDGPPQLTDPARAMFEALRRQ